MANMQIALLVLVLLGFPAISWYYLNTGLDYHKGAMAELGDHGALPLFERTNYDGTPLNTADLHGSIVIASVYDLAQTALSEQFGQAFSKLHDQFDERRDVLFLSVVGADSTLIPAFIEKYELADPEQCYFFATPEEAMKTLAQSGFRMPELQGAGSPFIAFADTASVIRNYYDVRDADKLKRLVEHTALLLPHIKDRDELYFKREKEK